MRSFTCLLWILTLTTSCVLEDQPVGGGDAGICGSCPTPRPVCHEETRRVCSARQQDSSACVDDTPVCDAENLRMRRMHRKLELHHPDRRAMRHRNERVRRDAKGTSGLRWDHGASRHATTGRACNARATQAATAKAATRIHSTAPPRMWEASKPARSVLRIASAVKRTTAAW